MDYDMMDQSVVKNQNRERVTTVEKLESRSWDRDNLDQRFSEVRNNQDTIESILQNIREELEDLPSDEELRDDWGKYFDRVEKDEKGNPMRYPPAFVDVARDRNKLLTRYAVWEARLQELNNFALRKFHSKFMDLLEEFRAASSYETIEEALDNKAEKFAERMMDEKVARVEERINQVEKLGQALREERRSDRETRKKLVELVKDLTEDVDSVDEGMLEELVEESTSNALDEFIKSNGVFELDQDELEQDERDSEREAAAEYAGESAVDDVLDDNMLPPSVDYDEMKDDQGTWLLKDKSFEERVSVLLEMWDELSIDDRVESDEHGVTKSDIAEKTDVSQATIFNSGLFEKIEEEYGMEFQIP